MLALPGAKPIALDSGRRDERRKRRKRDFLFMDGKGVMVLIMRDGMMICV